jgi:hypothetical protein
MLVYKPPPPPPKHELSLFVDDNNTVHIIEEQTTNTDDIFDPMSHTFDFRAHFNTYTLESILHTWGGSYVGCWRSDVVHGKGVIKLSNGQEFRALFCNGKLTPE